MINEALYEITMDDFYCVILEPTDIQFPRMSSLNHFTLKNSFK